MDEIDRKIINFLSVDARMRSTEIAGKVHRSRVAVQNRIESLIKDGEILGFGIALRRKAVPAIFEICLKPKSKCEDILPKFRAMFNINKAWSVTGNKDLFIWTEVDEAQDLQVMRTYLSEQQEVSSVSTHIVIKTYE
ncbi:AsnC family transcriptional regulator [Comamonadaceae bacterium M7527]|nr:AsnC family transcriptional regulator [Comamonadaceae bacterium M7527]